jgi:DNA repair exonuclease SbcCD ATPase subunit
MLDALTFVLYGKPFRNINLPLLVNSINGKDCVAEIEFSLNSSKYKVTRGLAPKLFVIEKDGKIVEQTANAKDYQAILEGQILKMNYKTFCQVVILGSTNYVPFMRLPAADRRNIVENLLDIDVFSKMNEVLKTRLSETKESLRDVEGQISTAKMRIEHKADMIKKIEEKSDSQLESYKTSAAEEQKSLQALLEKKAELQTEIAALAESVASVDKQRDSLSQMNALRKQMQGSVKKVQDEREFYKQNEDCPVCKHELPDEFRQEMISKKESRETELALGLRKMEQMLELSQGINDFLFEHEILDDRERDRDFFVAARSLSRLIEIEQAKRPVGLASVTQRASEFLKDRIERWKLRMARVNPDLAPEMWPKIRDQNPFIKAKPIINETTKQCRL